MRALVFIFSFTLLSCVSPSLETSTRSRGDFTKIAFIGDTGVGSGFAHVLDLIQAEKVDLVIVLGDTDYDGTENEWDRLVRDKLGPEPAIVVFGNHDYDDSNAAKITDLGRARLSPRSDIQCRGTYGEKFVCSIAGVYIVMSALPFGGGSRESHEKFLADELAKAPAGHWRVCAWHANQNAMQLGNKADEMGWTAYETCRKKGAIIATAHEHSYSRTFPLKDMTKQSKASEEGKNFEISEGASFVFVSGLGGHSIRAQRRSGAHWASAYTSSQGATYGALFGEFNADKAKFYFKNINGKIVDEFHVTKKY